MATIETAKESERGIVDIETLKATNESLISTLDEVMKIQKKADRSAEMRKWNWDESKKNSNRNCSKSEDK